MTAQRSDRIVEILTEAFTELMARTPPRSARSSGPWPGTRSRSTAAPPACSTPTSVRGGPFAGTDDAWLDADGASRIWIQGDLHAENFGTYLDAGGRLVFDVNDFDEAYLGHWTWDVMRFCASLACSAGRRRCPTR